MDDLLNIAAIRKRALIPVFGVLSLAVAPAHAENIGMLIKLCSGSSSGAYVACQKLLTTVQKLNKQAVLAKIATEANLGSEIHLAAIAKLTDQAALARIAASNADPNFRVAAAAAEKLTDPAVLAALATDDKAQDEARIAAAKKVTANSLLRMLCVSPPSKSLRIRRGSGKSPRTKPTLRAV